MTRNDSIATVASSSSSSQPDWTSQKQTSSRPSSPQSVNDRRPSALPWILHHILDDNTVEELPLRIMFSFNAGKKLPSLKEVHKLYQYDPRGRKIIDFISSLPQEDLESRDSALNQFMDENHEFSPHDYNDIKLLPLGGFPVHFIQNMCRRVFLREYKQVDFSQALACLDYLHDLECSRRAALRDAALRLSINEYNWKSILAEEPEAFEWVSKVQQQELAIESAYATVFVDLRIWTMIHELQSDPFYKPNVLAMLNTLFPPGLTHVPNDKVDVRRLTNYRNTFYKHIRAVDTNGSGIIVAFVEKLMNPSTKHSWPETRRQLEEYLTLVDTMIREAKAVDGIEYFHEASSACHSRTTSNAKSAATDRPNTASSANTSYDNSSLKSPTTDYDYSKGSSAYQKRCSDLFDEDSFFEIPPLPSSAPVDPTKDPYVKPRERAASIITNSNIAKPSSPQKDGQPPPRAGGLSIQIPESVRTSYDKNSPTHQSPLVDDDIHAHKRSESDQDMSGDSLSKVNTKSNQPASATASKRGIFHGGFDFLNHPFHPGHASTESATPKLRTKKSLTDIILRRKSSVADLTEFTANTITSSDADTVTESNRFRMLKFSSNLQRTTTSSNATVGAGSNTHGNPPSSPRVTEPSIPAAEGWPLPLGSRPASPSKDQSPPEVTEQLTSIAEDMGLGKLKGKFAKVKWPKNQKAMKQARKDGERIMADRAHKTAPEPSLSSDSEEGESLNEHKRVYLPGDHIVANAGSDTETISALTMKPENPYQLTTPEEFERAPTDLFNLGFPLINAIHFDSVDPDAQDLNTSPHEDIETLGLESQPVSKIHEDEFNLQYSGTQSSSSLHEDKDPSVPNLTSRKGKSPTVRTPDSQFRNSRSLSNEFNPELTYDSIGRRPNSSLSFDHEYYREMVDIAKKRLAVRYAANPEQAYEDYRADFIEQRRDEREKEARAARAEEEAEIAARLKAAKAEEEEAKQQEIYRAMNEEQREAWNSLAILEGIKPRDADGKIIEDYQMTEPEGGHVMPTPEEIAAARKEREKPRLLLILKHMLRKKIEIFEDEWDAIFEEFGMTCAEVNQFARESGLIDEEGEEIVRENSEDDSDPDDTELDDHEEVIAPNDAASIDSAAGDYQRLFMKSGMTEEEFKQFATKNGWVEHSEAGEHDASEHDGIEKGLEYDEDHKGRSVSGDASVSGQGGSVNTLDTRTKELQNLFEESGMTMEEFTEWLRENNMVDSGESSDHEGNEGSSVMSTTLYHTDSPKTRKKKLQKLFWESGKTWEKFEEWLWENDMVESDDEEDASEGGGPTSAAGTLGASTEEWPAFIEHGMSSNEIAKNARDNGLLDEYQEGDGECEEFEGLERGSGGMSPEEVGEWVRQNAALEVNEQEGSVSTDAVSQAYPVDAGIKDLSWYEDGDMSGWIGVEKGRGPPGLLPLRGREKACSV